MRQMLSSSGLSIDQKTYYNLIRNKPLKQSNNSFKGLMLTLKKKSFRFTYSILDELANDENIKGRVLKQVFFILNT
jgi:hypothetical protein